jgi:hypothetical protein
VQPGRFFKEEHMRSLLRFVATSAGLGLILLAMSPAGAITLATPAAVRAAADTLVLTEAVHCRSYPHLHTGGHGWGFGCGDKRAFITRRGSSGVYSPSVLPQVRPLPSAARPPGNYYSPTNPQDRSGNSNRQDMLQPRKVNPQDMR